MSWKRKFLGLHLIREFPAKAILFCAIPQRGKTTRLQLEIAKDAIEQREEYFRPWPLPRFWSPPPIFCYDPKKELGAVSYDALMRSYESTKEERYNETAKEFRKFFGDKELADFDNFQFYDTAGEAAIAAMQDMRGILIVEELLTVDPSDYPYLTRAMAIRRTSTEGNGLTIYATTQRPKIMPVAMRAIPDEIWMGQIVEPIDIDALRSVIGPQNAARLPTVPRGDWVIYKQSEPGDAPSD